MRKPLLIVWLLLPVLAGAYHYGPGQSQLELDDAGRLIQEADQHAANKDWWKAVQTYDAALTVLPKHETKVVRRIRLERAKAQMFVAQLPAASAELKTLVSELNEDPNCDPELIDDARAALANSQYYRTWLMRLEGLPRTDWEPEIDAARQTYKLLAEKSLFDGDATASQKHQEDLESVIRLARMDLSDLQGLPLPSQ